MTRGKKVLLAVLLIVTIPSAGRADETLYGRMLRSTAWIVAGDSSGSGVLVDAQAKTVATSYHVVQQTSEVVVCFPQCGENGPIAESAHYRAHLGEIGIKGKVTAVDPRRDLALVQLESIPDGVDAMPLAAAPPAPGERIHSVGNPGSSQALWVYTSGTVRQVYNLIRPAPLGYMVEAEIVETQSPVNPGDSGGPAVNEQGELVGLVVSFRTDARLVSHCIAVSELRDLLAGNYKSIDGRVRQALTDKKLNFGVNVFGVFRMIFQYNDKPDVLVLVRSATERWGKLELREIEVPVLTADRPLGNKLFPELLARNGQYKLGAWSVEKIDGKEMVVFSVKIDADADAQQLYDAVDFVLAVVNASRDDVNTLAASADLGIEQLAGVWHAELAAASDQKMALQLSLASDGAFTWEEPSAVFRGKYVPDDGSLTVTFNGKPQKLAVVRSADGETLVLHVGDRDIAFQRSETTPADKAETVQTAASGT